MSAQGWKIDLAGVKSVLHDVSGSVNGTASALQSVQGGVAEVAGGAGDVVNEALGAFLTKTQDDVDQVTYRLIGGVQGVTNAVDAYKAGDLDMAANAQRAGVTAADTHDVSFFVQAAERQR